MIKVVSIVTFAMFLISCEEKAVLRGVTGAWSIDTIEYRGYDVKPCLATNLLVFKADKLVDIPRIFSECNTLHSTEKTGHWEVRKTRNDTLPYKIMFLTKDSIFQGEHIIVFHREKESRQLKMEVVSDSLYMVCTKLMFIYGAHLALTERLERITWKNRPE